jgi:hypothetical protein
MTKQESAQRDQAAEKLQAQIRGKAARKEVEAMKNEQKNDEEELKKQRKIKKEELKKKKIEKEKAKKTETITLDFEVQLDQPLGMKIDHVEGRNTYPAEITEVVPNGQGEIAGVQVGMYVIEMNGVSTKDQVLDDIVQGVIAAKTNQTPLTMKLQKGGV